MPVKFVPPEALASTPFRRPWFRAVRLAILAIGAFGIAFGLTKYDRTQPSAPAGMTRIAGGEFVMGSPGRNFPANEQPEHRVWLDDFWIDQHEVTNAKFRAFVEATKYLTTAEKAPDWEELKKGLAPGTPKPSDETLVPGSLVFTPPGKSVRLDNTALWWNWVPGADWKHPEGPGSNLNGRENHPVVQVSWDDANAFAKWAGKRLPTEAEWECAARGGVAAKRYTWGDTPPTETSKLANIWQGTFPNENTQVDGFARTAPVESFPPNDAGLYDMAGNVWEWCSDWYRADAYEQATDKRVRIAPIGPTDSWDPNEPHTVKRVTRGGSFLCHVTYCESYRPGARRGTAPDTGMSHLGFRCVRSDPNSEKSR